MEKQRKIKNFATAALLTIAPPTIATIASLVGFETGNDEFSALTSFSCVLATLVIRIPEVTRTISYVPS